MRAAVEIVQRQDTPLPRALPAMLRDGVLFGLLCAAVLLTLQNMIGVGAPLLVGCVVAFAGALVYRFTESRGRMRTVLLVVLVVALVADVLVGVGGIANALLVVANGYIEASNVLNASVDDLFVVTATVSDMTRFCVFVALVLVLVVGSILRRESRVELSLLALVVLLAALFFGSAPTPILVAFLVVWLLVMVRMNAGMELGASVLACFAAVLVAVAVIGVGAVGGFNGSLQLYQAKQTVVQGVDQVRFGSDDLPQGSLANSPSMLSGDTTDRLEVTFADANMVSSMYLRGYTGAAYSENAWNSLDLSDYQGDWQGLVSSMRAAGLDPLYQYAAYETVDVAENGGTAVSSQVTINNLGAYRKFAYQPYTATGSASEGGTESAGWLDRFSLFGGLNGGGSYTYDNSYNAEATELSNPSEWVYAESDDDNAQFLQMERAYSSFVHEKYLTVDDALSDTVDRFFFADGSLTGAAAGDAAAGSADSAGATGVSASTSEDLYTLTTRIRTLLAASCAYSSNPDAVPTDTDAIDWFLKEGGSGNAALYASAAVMAYREAGVPARYVEGYLLSNVTANTMRADAQTQVTLTSKDAHAWVEVYVDGMGWMPIEVTPGFYTQAYNTESVVQVPERVPGGGVDNNLLGSYNPVEESTPDDITIFGIPLGGFIGALALLVALGFAIAELQRELRGRALVDRLRACACDEVAGGSAVGAAGPVGATGAHVRGTAGDAAGASAGAVDATRAVAPAEFARICFDRLNVVLGQTGATVDSSRLFENIDALVDAFPTTQYEEHERMILAMQGSVFGGMPLDVAQRRALVGYLNKLEGVVVKDAGSFKKLRLRYVSLFGMVGRA